MSYLGQYNGFTMGDDIESWEEELARRIPATDVERRHGSLITGDPVLAQRIIRVSGKVASANEAARRTRMNSYGLALAEGTRANLYKYSDRIYKARCQSFRIREVDGGALAIAEFDVEFLCDDPFVYNSALTTDTQTVTTSPKAWTHNNGGGYLVYPTISITANAGGSLGMTNPRLTNSTTGKYIQYTGTIAPGSTLAMDCAAFTVKVGGTSYLQNFDTGGVFVWLKVGDNNLSFSFTGDAPSAFSVSYYQRWIEE